jgi:enamine deaminase RidA (YjgF/YER057c/UK114 family)
VEIFRANWHLASTKFSKFIFGSTPPHYLSQTKVRRSLFSLYRLESLIALNTLLFTIHPSTFNLGLQMKSTTINPASLGAPKGYSNGLLFEPGGRLLFIAGQVAWDQNQKIVSDQFVEQFDQALANLLTVVAAAGGAAENIARLVIYVTTKSEYVASLKSVGKRYRQHMGKHFPAMVLVEVKSLLDDAAKVEIEGIAILV